MRKFVKGHRYLVVLTGLVTVVFASSFVLPAFGAPGPTTLAKRALRQAKAADTRSKTADKRSKTALKEANEPGPRGPGGPGGPQGVQGPQGAQGGQGPAGTARAYAAVTTTASAATVVPAKSSPGTTATRLSAGHYCVALPGASSTTRPGVVAPAEFSSNIIRVTAEIAQTSSCSNATAYEVLTKDDTTSSGIGNLSDGIPFNIIVP